VILCGRSSDVWEEKEDPDDGAMELKKVGTKMRAEREISYEPSLLVEMAAVQVTPQVGGKVVRRAFVKKDRFDVIDGQHFDNPTFESFMPHIALLNIGGEHKAIEPGRSSEEMFERGDTGAQRAVDHDILVEKIEAEIKLLYPGQAEADKTGRSNLMQTVFNTRSWTEIKERRTLEQLAAGLESIRAIAAEEAAKAIAASSPAEKPKPEPTNGKNKTKGARA
jgi:hypothetical protein